MMTVHLSTTFATIFPSGFGMQQFPHPLRPAPRPPLPLSFSHRIKIFPTLVSA